MLTEMAVSSARPMVEWLNHFRLDRKSQRGKWKDSCQLGSSNYRTNDWHDKRHAVKTWVGNRYANAWHALCWCSFHASAWHGLCPLSGGTVFAPEGPHYTREIQKQKGHTTLWYSLTVVRERADYVFGNGQVYWNKLYSFLSITGT